MIRGFIKKWSVLILVSFCLVQCTKVSTTTIGSEIIPGADGVDTKDTLLNVIANNLDGKDICDSILHNDLLALGTIDNDPIFGNSTGEIYFEVKPSTFPLTLPAHDDNTLEIDSVVLVLGYTHSFGDTNVVQKVTVHELTNGLRFDSLYKTCQQQPYAAAVLGERTFTPTSLKDSVFALDGSAVNQLRIKLDDAFGSSFFEKLSDLTNDTLYRDYFKGLAVVPDETVGGNALNYFDLQSANTKLSFYVRYKNDGDKDTAVVNLGYTSLSGQANYIHRDRGSSEMTDYLDDNPDGDSLLFIQTAPAGAYASLKIPGLSDMPNVLIHRAELVLTQLYDPTNETMNPPVLLYLDILDDDGDYIPIPCDFTANELQAGFPNLGGRPRRVKDENGMDVYQYTFNLPRYVQSLLTKNADNVSLRLRAPAYVTNLKSYIDRCGQPVNPFNQLVNNLSNGRIKLNGTQVNPSGLRLRLVYSTL